MLGDVIVMSVHLYMIRMVGDRVTDCIYCFAIDEPTLRSLTDPRKREGYIAVDKHTYHVACNARRCGLPFGETHPEQRTGLYHEQEASG